MRQLDADALPGLHGEPGAVPLVGAGGAVAVTITELSLGEGQRALALAPMGLLRLALRPAPSSRPTGALIRPLCRAFQSAAVAAPVCVQVRGDFSADLTTLTVALPNVPLVGTCCSRRPAARAADA